MAQFWMCLRPSGFSLPQVLLGRIAMLIWETCSYIFATRGARILVARPSRPPDSAFVGLLLSVGQQTAVYARNLAAGVPCTRVIPWRGDPDAIGRIDLDATLQPGNWRCTGLAPGGAATVHGPGDCVKVVSAPHSWVAVSIPSGGAARAIRNNCCIGSNLHAVGAVRGAWQTPSATLCERANLRGQSDRGEHDGMVYTRFAPLPPESTNSAADASRPVDRSRSAEAGNELTSRSSGPNDPNRRKPSSVTMVPHCPAREVYRAPSVNERIRTCLPHATGTLPGAVMEPQYSPEAVEIATEILDYANPAEGADMPPRSLALWMYTHIVNSNA